MVASRIRFFPRAKIAKPAKSSLPARAPNLAQNQGAQRIAVSTLSVENLLNLVRRVDSKLGADVTLSALRACNSPLLCGDRLHRFWGRGHDLENWMAVIQFSW